MVSLWPWKGDDTSPASFEKALSALSEKIAKTQLTLDTLRQRSRRLKALWTLYTSFAYLLSLVLLAFVVGWKNWGAVEWSSLAGSPVLIYLVRSAIDAYYSYRIDSSTSRLEEFQTERVKTIDKLKAATKYNSTQQLLEKYGGAPVPKPKSKSPANTPSKASKQPQRTTIAPPPTANIPRGEPPSNPTTPQRPQGVERPISVPNTPVQLAPAAEFAPNAFSAPPQYDHAGELNAGGKWYDRFLDVLLGEDELLPKNRIVLICKHCRLVNGQAPPGTKRMEELGEWRCMGCGGTNGILDEGTKIVKEMKEMVEKSKAPEVNSEGESSAEQEVSLNEQKILDDEKEGSVRRRKTRSGES